MSVQLVGSHRVLDNDVRAAKNEKIVASYKETKERRKRQTPRVVDLKIVTNKLSSTQREALERLFVEAKWAYNDAIGSDNVFKYQVPKKTVAVHTPNGVEQREFKVLGSQMKQSIVSGARSSVKTLASLKKKGKKVGRLKFKSRYTSINLKQAGTTYKIKGSKARVQNIPGWVRVRGVAQLEGTELANAKLVRRPDGFHLLVTTYRFTHEIPSQIKHKGVVGVDFGVKTSLTLSTGEKFDIAVGETERLRRLQRKLSRQEKGSNNYMKTQDKISREYQHITNRRNDIANKLSREILGYEHVFMQDENIAGWKSKRGYARGGRKIQHSVLGRVKARLYVDPRVTVLGKRVATTATCICGVKTKHTPDKRTFVCASCGYSDDRDIHAAKNMIRLSGVDNLELSTDRTELTPVELTTSSCDVVGRELGSVSPHAQVRPDEEAGNPSAFRRGVGHPAYQNMPRLDKPL